MTEQEIIHWAVCNRLGWTEAKIVFSKIEKTFKEQPDLNDDAVYCEIMTAAIMVVEVQS